MNMYYYFITPLREVWAHKTSLTAPFLIEVPVLNQESERSFICVIGVSILPLLRYLVLDLGTVPTV
jgi:hypothetical protein